MLEQDDFRLQLKSKFNAALAQLYRLDDVWRDSSRHSRGGALNKWNLDLDAVWRELSEDISTEAKFKKEDKKTMVETFDAFNKDLVDIGLFKKPTQLGFEAISKDDFSNKSKVYSVLMAKEIFLRRIQNWQGKGSVKEEDVEGYMD